MKNDEIEKTPCNKVIGVQDCEERIVAYFKDFSLPFIEVYKDKDPAEISKSQYTKAGISKSAKSYGLYSTEISFTTDMDGLLTHLDYHVYI